MQRLSRRRLLQQSGIAILSFALGCDFSIECTSMGCYSYLSVAFTSDATRPYRVEVTSAGSETKSFDCPEVSKCQAFGGDALFEDYLPETATIKVITAAGTTTKTVKPVYFLNYPNGKRCGHPCSIGRVTADFPAG